MSTVIEVDASNGSKLDKFSNRWWTQKDSEMFKHVFGTVKLLETKQSYRTQENIKHARLYSDLEVMGAYAGLYNGSADKTLTNRLSLNVIKSCIDTVTSKIAKSKTRPMFLTEDGNYPLRKKAEKLTKFMDGQFDAMNHYETKQDTFRDACIFGTGFTKFYIDWQAKKICSERVVPEEIIVDDAEGIYGCPQNLYQRRLMNKDVLAEMFPKCRAQIFDATADLEGGIQYSPGYQDLVRVVEAWHLPSGPEAKDGKHVISIGNCTLWAGAWTHDFFPFSVERWNKSIVGYYGIGIARELTGIQIEINKILRNIQQSMHLFAVPRVFKSTSSVVNLAAINNDIGSIVNFSGVNPPSFYTPQAMSPDVYQHLWNLHGKAFEICGVSALSATSQKPAGLDSGRALREFTDIESDRFQIVGQRRESSFIADTKIIIEFAKMLSEKEPGFKVKVSDSGSSQTIKWKDVNLDEDKYMLRTFPASILPTQPAAKMQTIVEYAQAGFFDKETAMDLMDFPDIEAATSVQLSPRRITLKMLDEMIESGIYQPPEPYMNLDLSQSLSQYYYLNAKMQGVPEPELELIRRFMDQIVSLKMASQPPPMDPQAMPPGMAPEGQEPAMPASPEAMPTNPMIQQGV